MKKVRIVSTILVFTMAVAGAFAFNTKPKNEALNITAYNVSNCTTSASVNCSTNAVQTCTIGGVTYKLKDASQNCTVTLGLNP